MPTALPTALPDIDLHAQLDRLLRAPGPLDAAAARALLDGAYADDSRLDRRERAALRAILRRYGDRLSPEGARTLTLITDLENATLRDAARQMVTDGALDPTEAQGLAALAAADGQISKRERTTLRAILDLYAGQIAPAARAALRRALGLAPDGAAALGEGSPATETSPGAAPSIEAPPVEAPPVEGSPSLALGPVGLPPSHQAWRLSGGVVSAAPERPASDVVEVGDALYRVARLIDDQPLTARLFHPVDPDADRALFGQCAAAITASHAPPVGVTEVEGLQLRSSAFTVLVHLTECLSGAPAASALAREVEDAVLATARAETHPVLRDAFAYAAHRLAPALGASGREAAEALFAAVVPRTPPYAAWFGDTAPSTLVVRWYAGQGSEGFLRGTIELLEREGYAPEGAPDAGQPAVYTRRYGDTTVRIRVALFANNLFESMDDPAVHIIGYDGHSDIGRNMRRALRRAPDLRGAKLVFYGLCAGKDALFRVRARYPEAQLMTTFNSSYFRTAPDSNGTRRMVESENFNALMQVVEGVAYRQDWAQIRDEIHDKAIPRYWRGHHALPGGANYVTPIDTALRRAALDSDADGQADALDRLVDFNPFAVAASTRDAFTPVDPGRPAHALSGVDVHVAANTCNTAMLYNPLTKKYNDTGRIVGGGYADLGPTDPITRWTLIELGGETAWQLEVNRHYAHLGEEATRAVALYAWNAFEHRRDPGLYRRRWRASTWQSATDRPDPADVALMGLTLATFTLAYDMKDGFSGPHHRDREIWRAMGAHFGLPALDFRPIHRLIYDEKHDYAGSPAMVQAWRETLSAEQIAALSGG